MFLDYQPSVLAVSFKKFPLFAKKEEAAGNLGNQFEVKKILPDSKVNHLVSANACYDTKPHKSFQSANESTFLLVHILLVMWFQLEKLWAHLHHAMSRLFKGDFKQLNVTNIKRTLTCRLETTHIVLVQTLG